MSDPITPLTPQQAVAEEASTVKESWWHRSLVAFDIACNVIVLRGQPDETISSHAARADEEGKRWGKVLSGMLDWFQPDHGAAAQAGDVERAENVERIEEQSGGFKK